ncbi:MAG: hypothetical protein L0Z62_07225 [Gemmataceae bacterium]|nr:hypothetical protein [Gemmataceae bacterium]
MLTDDRLGPPPFDPPTGCHAPEIPRSLNGQYTGGRLDLNTIDLGEYLQALGQLGPRLGLHQCSPSFVFLFSDSRNFPSNPNSCSILHLMSF